MNIELAFLPDYPCYVYLAGSLLVMYIGGKIINRLCEKKTSEDLA